MKNAFKKLSLIACAAFVGAVGLAACQNAGKSTLLASPAEHSAMTWSEHNVKAYTDITDSANSFAADFSDAVYSSYDGSENLALSPVSVYMALALTSECASGDTRDQILNALGQSEQGLSDGFGYLYRSLNYSYTTGGLVTSNSVWLQEGLEFEEDCINSLAEDYYCYSYAADFRGDNGNANAAVRHFVREQTNKLIDVDFEFSEQTCFALVSTLYLKDAWNLFGRDIALTDSDCVFTQSDGSQSSGKFLQGSYLNGRAQKGENFSTFYTSTHNGFRIHFILPDDGCTVRDAFNAADINYVLGISDYGGTDDANRVRYLTHCLFPQFSASFDGDVKGTLQNSFGITCLFDENECNLSSLISGGVNDYGQRVYCPEVRHITNLKVDRKGIEGAAVTVIPGAGAAGPDEYEEVFEDFVVDRAFGYVLTDPYGTVLFTGVVNNI